MSESLESLVAALNDPRAEVRRGAVLRVSEAFPNDPTARVAIVAALNDPVWCVRESASISLRHFSDTDGTHFRLLVGLSLSDPSPHVRRAAAATAGPSVRPERDYGNAVRHRFERQRVRAATALGHVSAARATEAVGLLALCASDSHPKVRLAGLRSLSRLEPAAVLSVLPIVLRKCVEANSDIALAARDVWECALSAPAAEPLRVLQPYPGTANWDTVQRAIDVLPADHLLRRAWSELLVPSAGVRTARELAKQIARVCERLLPYVLRAPS
ncbi:hypothetical protein FTUN_8044 [Frigoriglobus tundricola]|uniref:HEAT repeat domain-containing protein n=1 Tax=Frigoriglobus tundricola TaxID=2774151 RepID=A0A6M5Z4L5_9BACT|nr:hypothetical protein FTUN_8044 [Frigoriglobus tundricola]